MTNPSDNPGCLSALLGLFGLRLERQSHSPSEVDEEQPPVATVLPMPLVTPAPLTPTPLYPVVQPTVIPQVIVPPVVPTPLAVMPPVIPPVVITPPIVLTPPVQPPPPIVLTPPVVLPVSQDTPPVVTMPGYLPPLTSTADPAYQKRDSVFTYRERVFYAALLQAVGSDYWTFAKVRLADFIWLPKDAVDHRFHNNAILCKHIDFLLCSWRRYRPVLGIELDDPTHRYPDHQKRDEFKDRTFATIGLPLLRITMAQSYDIADLRQQIKARLPFSAIDDGEQANDRLDWRDD